MIEIQLTDGLQLLVDPDKFTVQGGIAFNLTGEWSNEVVITFDANLRDILEGNETKVAGVVTLRSK